MKKILFVFTVVSSFLIFSSCSKTNEHKAKDAIKKYIMQNIDNPKSYESANWGALDSISKSMDDDDGYIVLKADFDTQQQRVKDVTELYNSITENSKQFNEIKGLKAQSERRLYVAEKALSDYVKNREKIQGCFIIEHSYRATNDKNAIMLFRKSFIVDPEFKEVIDVVDYSD